MEEKLKERLFGALVIVALGVIFVPMLFDKPVPSDVDPSKALPTQPTWDVGDIALVAPEDMQAYAPAADTSVVFDFPKNNADVTLPPMPKMQDAKAPKPEAPLTASEEISKAFTPKAWSVQLATFSDYQNAKRLEGSLRKEGYPAYTVQSYNGDTLLTRVLVGPEIEKQGASTLADTLQSRFDLKGMVIPYDPLAG